ncbi:MAG TPA: FecR domain-containing protein [Planctomycetota bacterium]|nr:FecR domain-containing protein [Planctomycetota bacterium]
MTDPDLLISAHLDDGLDAAGHAELEAWLHDDRANRLRFLRAVADHQALRKRAQPVKHVSRRTLRRIRRTRQRSPLRFVIPAVAALAAALVVAVLLRGPDAPAAPDAVAEVVAADAELPTIAAASGASIERAGRASAASPSATLAIGDRVIVDADGQVELRYVDGTALRLAAGARVLVEDARAGKRLAVEDGVLSAEVAAQPAGRPASFRTAHAEVEVIGTRLSIAVAGTESSVAVSHGRVGVTRRDDGARIELGAGETGLIAHDVPLRARPTGSPSGTVHRVGAGQPYATLVALPPLAAGDVVEIHPGTYREALKFTADGTSLRPIVIRGVGAERPLIDGTGIDTSGEGAVPRGLMQIEGDHYVVERLRFTGARNGVGSAAIRGHDCRATVIRDCVIADCDVGIDVVGDDLLIEDCDIGGCGTGSVDEPSPSVRLAGGRATLRGSHLHDSVHGMLLKVSCRVFEAHANRIVRGDDGEISLGAGSGGIDHRIAFVGNLIAGQAERRGNRLRFISIDTSKTAMTGTLDLVNNTFVAANPGVIFLMVTDSGLKVRADNTIFAGSSQIVEPGPCELSGRANWILPGTAVPKGFSAPATGAEPGFVDADADDFRLRRDSPCRGRAVASLPVLRQPASRPAAGSTPRRDAGDLGAFAD